jgi:hypothetical protein
VRTLVLLVVFIALVSAGCGGGSSQTTTRSETRQTGEPSSEADYIAVGDAICKNHQSRREDLESQAGELGPIVSAGQAHRIAALLRKESANRLAEVRELEALPTHSAGDATAASVFPLIRAEAKVIEDWAGAYDDLDRRRIRRLQFHLAAISQTTAGRARKYGFEVCGQS